MTYFMKVITALSCLTALANGQLTYRIVGTGITTFYSDINTIRAPSLGQAFYGQDATFPGATPTYQDNGDGTVTDLVTQLMWQKDMGAKVTYSQAVSAARNSRVGGYSDWRVASIKELFSLIIFTGDMQQRRKFIDETYFTQPYGNTSLGERDIDAQTLTKTQYTGYVFGNQQCMFGVNFIDGRIKCYPKFRPFYYRLVRGRQNYGENKFVDNAGLVVNDEATGLMWQKADSGRGMDWQSALQYCQNMSLGGYGGWRLPNVKELQSIVDYGRGPQTTGSAAIDPLFNVSKVSVPGGLVDFPYFWSSTTHLDGPPATMGAYVAFGEAWGMMNGQLLDVHGAGAQRSDPKSARAGRWSTYPQYFGPQGDMRVLYNHVRCVRDMYRVWEDEY